ncbi:putative two-component transcriptional regulator, winged helix family [Magnetospirillum gryphiswaldense MSR-1 v2]|uniref:Two-component transcriptional regulator, winged helix family n=2 Tax=Magnetospirillum gryphiswaldense TaxID=55518 RepID=V6F5Q0_MAGGM|nr:two-component transcriptional regulator, winged helix family [Magnetospirillum gryphiswaldense MSR-1]CDK99150.1 putative two-component transcriptional regulator, winged helix family [Magnetospirillum gryphiswaldense MSR-1 v2]CDK99656.1 putative two-component transcriptional regulator, winged helix family [Magnetospirillum gryphiswaldense MSR-1 v2]
MRIVLVEDNSDFREEVQFHLQRAGHEVFIAADGAGLDQVLAVHHIEIAVLDLGLPGEDGLSITHRLRMSHPEIRILMLTARSSQHHRISGLEKGADSYLTKPVDMRELCAVIESIRRRISPAVADHRAPGWTLSLSTMTIMTPKGERITLTPTEMLLLRPLAEAAPDIVSRQQFAKALGHREEDYDYRRLEAVISRLRRKIATSDEESSVIKPARGRGYIFAAPITVIP